MDAEHTTSTSSAPTSEQHAAAAPQQPQQKSAERSGTNGRDKYLRLPHGQCRYRRYRSTHTHASTMPSQLVVMIHGIGAYGFMFKPLIRAMLASTQHNLDVVVPDLWGRGESDDASHMPQTDDLFNQQIIDVLVALELIDAPRAGAPAQQGQPAAAPSPAPQEHGEPRPAKHKNFVLIGHSMGGAVVMSFAAKHGELVSQLGLLAPAGVAWPVTPTLSKMLSLVPSTSLAQFFLRSFFNPDLDRKLHQEFFLPDHERNVALSEWFNSRRLRSFHADRYFATYVNTLKHFKPLFEAPVDVAARNFVHKPVLLIVAERDHITPVQHVLPQVAGAFKAAGCQHFSVAAVRSTRHSFFLERLQTSANILLKWIGTAEDAAAAAAPVAGSSATEPQQMHKRQHWRSTGDNAWLAESVHEDDRALYLHLDAQMGTFLASLAKSDWRDKALKKDARTAASLWRQAEWGGLLI